MIAKIQIAFAATLGLVAGWVIAAELAAPGHGIRFFGIKLGAALLGGTAAAVCAWLWTVMQKIALALFVLGVGAVAVVGIGLWAAFGH